jgi:ligand-binding sensor domain-containing protein
MQSLINKITMKKYFSIQIFSFCALLVFVTACNGPVKKNLHQENEHPKLIKTIGDPKYGSVQCILEDKAGNLWFGTTENGLYKFDGKIFSRYLIDDGLNSNNISCILEDKEGKIWIGTHVGLCIYNPSASIKKGDKLFTEIKIPLPKDQPVNKNELYRNSHWVFNMMQAKNGKIWFATIDGVFIYDGKTFTPFNISKISGGFLSSNNNAERILEDNAGNIWFGGRSTEGVFCYDGKTITNFKLDTLFQDGPKPKPNTWAWPQLQDKNGNIWFSNWGGVYRYNPSAPVNKESKPFTSFTKKDGLPGGVTKIMEDKNGNLWLGGDAGSGLSRFDGKSFTQLTEKEGLLNNSIWSILEDKNGNIWVGTRETGLYLFDGKSFITYSEYKQ